MADIHFEIFDNADFGNKNLRFSEAPAQEQRDFLKQNGYGFTTRYGGVWYPRTKEAKDRNTDFVKEFAEKFYPENKKNFQSNQIEQLAESALENGSIEIKASIDNRIAYLENLIAELKEERKRDQEKISRLEAALENQTEENIAELEMRQEQAELDDETEWEKENTLTEAEERAYLEKQSEIKIPAETIKLSSEMLDSLYKAAEKESLADEPQAEKEILHDSEKSVDNNLTVSPKELAIAKSVLPTVQYVSTLKFAQGEEREFFVHKIKEIAAAVENAPKINETDGLEEHQIILRYFHPSGTQSFVTEIGNDGDAFGFQCLNDDWENAEWGYLNIDELKNIRGMEVDFHVPAGMTVEKFIQKQKSEQYSAEDIDESLKPVYFNDLSDVQKEEVINGYRSADDQQMLETWQKELENSSETDKDIASNPPTDEWIENYLSEIKADFNTGYWQDIFKSLEKEESHGKTISELSADEASRLSEEKYGFYFEYSDDENVADIYSAKDGDFVGSYGAGGFGYADNLSGNDPVAKIPEENFREVLELAEIFYHKKAAEYENLIETENGQMMNPDEAHEWNEEQKMQYSQENDERAAENAGEDFETTKRLGEIVSEIKNSDFTLESKYENNLHSVALKNKDGAEIFSAMENNSIVIPVEHTIAVWANDEASEKAKGLADEFFNLVCEDGIRGGDYVNAVFKNESPVYEDDFESDLLESNISYTAENYYQVNDRFAIEIVPAENSLSSETIGDDWTVRFYDINGTEKFGEKGQFITSYYTSTILEHRKGTGLSMQGDVPAWTLDAETMDYVHDITFMWVDRHSSVQQKEERENVRSNLQSQDISAPRTKSDLRKLREQCREILKKPVSEITEDDKKILAQYEGGGGLNEDERTNSEVLNAFYTPDNLIEKVWELVDAYAPDAKLVLEPSAGVGKFANNRPNNKFTMHELDETSARINKILHPEADVIQGAFQKQFLDDGERFLKIGYEQSKHDVVIGNPPYGKYNDKYKGLGEGREFDRYEEYFIARGLDALKDEKSVLAFVVPSGFLSTADDRQKKVIASKGEILDAYRLPEGTFSTTEVGTDILIMRKKENLDDRENISSELLSDGDWFKNHPEKILGEVKTRTNRFGKKEEYVVVHEGLSIQDELNKIDSFVDEIKKANQTEKKEAEKSFETQLDEYNKKYWGPVEPGDTRYDISPVTEERLSEIKNLSKELSEYFENGVRPENDRFVIGKTPRVLQETGSEYTDVTVSVSVVKKAVETHGLSEKEILNALTRLATPILVFDSDKNATENKVESKLVLTDVFKDENPVALAVNVNDSVQKQENGHRKQIEVQNIRSIHDRTVVAKNGVDLIRKWTDDGLCRYVDDKKITDWSTIARVQFPIEVLQSDNSNILTRTSLVNSVFSEQMLSPLNENEKLEPEKQNSTSPKDRKERLNIVKSKGEVMSAEEFSHLYGRNFDEREFPIWKATDWQGNIDLSKLSGDDIQYLSECGKYVEKNIGEWTHRELFASGDIYEKIQEQRERYVKSDGNKIFADNIKLLESAMKSPLEIGKIHFGVKTALAESFKIEHIDAEGNKVNLNLQESFILWAQNAKLADRKWRGDIDFATANISREELGEELTFYDIVNYIDGKPVKAEPVRGWRTYDMSEEEKAAEKAERRKEADLKRQTRSDTANRLFDRYLHEGLSESDKKRLSAEYNRRFNSYVAPDYSKLPLFVDGMSAYKGDSKFKLYDQQIKGISFLCNKGNGLLAYDVGVGKTAAGIVATVNQIQAKAGSTRRNHLTIRKTHWISIGLRKFQKMLEQKIKTASASIL